MKTLVSLSDLLKFEGKTALITGAAKGIGRAIARRFAEAGSGLILVDNDRVGVEKLKNEITGVEVNAFDCDLSDITAIENFWKSIDGKKVDILVNNAGIYPFKKFLELDLAYLNKVMEVNLYSVLWMCQHMIKARKRKGGAIINLGTIEAIMPFKEDMVHYALSKIGVITLTRDLAREFGSKGFRINAILPGGILTHGTASAAKKAIATFDWGLLSDSYNFMQRIPAGRLGDPDEIAKMVVVLASDLASYVHGALIPVDGGFLSA
jgi:NAD(P)-dependent dehydrogenase (short-subunit alcohol dehydrogenase family)